MKGFTELTKAALDEIRRRLCAERSAECGDPACWLAIPDAYAASDCEAECLADALLELANKEPTQVSNLNGTTFFSRTARYGRETLRRNAFIRGNAGEKR